MCVIKPSTPSAASAAAEPQAQAQASKKPAVQGSRDANRLGAAGNPAPRKTGRGTLLTGAGGLDTSGQKTLLGS